MVVAKTKSKTPLLPRKIKKILRDLKKGLVEIYGDQLKAVYLFGSSRAARADFPIRISM
jgi:hypothetical protein